MAIDTIAREPEKTRTSDMPSGKLGGLLGSTRSGLVLLCGMIVAAALTRLIPHPYNFTPIGAMALFAGANIRNRLLAVIVPLAAMGLSDAFIQHDFLPMHVVIYATFAVMVGLGMLLPYCRASLLAGMADRGGRESAGRLRSMLVSVLCVGSFALFTSLLFFVVTNFACWLLYPFYEQTPAGLALCFTAAIPFFGNTLAGDLFYCTVLFGGFALAEQFVSMLKRRAVPAM